MKYCLKTENSCLKIQTKTPPKFVGITFCHPPNLGGFEGKRVIKKLNILTFHVKEITFCSRF